MAPDRWWSSRTGRGIPFVVRVPAATWAQQILTADAIEQRLWGAYEQAFAADHERSLAYRYEPANDEERALVLPYFPPVQYALTGSYRVTVGIEGSATRSCGRASRKPEHKGRGLHPAFKHPPSAAPAASPTRSPPQSR